MGVHLPWEEMYLSSILMNLDAITIKFALNNHFFPMELNRWENVIKLGCKILNWWRKQYWVMKLGLREQRMFAILEPLVIFECQGLLAEYGKLHFKLNISDKDS